MLFDFYGELLTEKQREYFDLHCNSDLSLAEIAEQTGISRQGVWDIIKRAEGTLRGIEEKTGLMRRFSERRDAILEIESDLKTLCRITEGQARDLAETALAKLKLLED
ncbi:MAG TPA: DNA-binding protein [Clostridiales bacterium]|nr:DNA-binding protein [Clostridiales bacterium]HBR08780.1 DNA-binding protein [Clostridiales bacterium]